LPNHRRAKLITPPTLEYVAGDDWEIRATLLDESGKPYDLSGSPIIKWILYDSAHNHIVDREAIITIIDATAGVISISSPLSQRKRSLVGAIPTLCG
jgi:hypothetical protein